MTVVGTHVENGGLGYTISKWSSAATNSDLSTMDWLMPRAARAAAVAILVPVATGVVNACVFTSIPMPLPVFGVRLHTSVLSVMPAGGVQPLVRPVQGEDACSCTVTSQSSADTGVMSGAVWVSVELLLGRPCGVTPSNGVAALTPLKLVRLATLSMVPVLQA